MLSSLRSAHGIRLCRYTTASVETLLLLFFSPTSRFLDLHEAIQDGDLSSLDNSDFRDTDIPFEVPLPETTFLTDAEHDQIKDWVLTVSMDAKVGVESRSIEADGVLA